MGSRFDMPEKLGENPVKLIDCDLEFVRLPCNRVVNVWLNHSANYDLDEMLFLSLFDPTSEIWRTESWRTLDGWISAMYFIRTSKHSPAWLKQMAASALERFYSFEAPKNLLTDGRQHCVWFENQTESKHGYVYIMVSDDKRYHKIGVSVSPPSRLKQISPLMPFDVSLLLTIKTNDMFTLEKKLHDEFRWARKKGEWFCLDDNAISRIVTKYPVVMTMEAKK